MLQHQIPFPADDSARHAKPFMMAAMMLCLYGISVFSKYLAFNAPELEQFGERMLATNLIELVLWFGTSMVYYRGLRAQVGLVLLYSVMAIYASVPLALLSFDLPIFPFDALTIRRAMLGQSLALTHVFVFTHLLITPSLVRRVDDTIDHLLAELRPRVSGEIVASLVGLAIALIYYQNFLSAGVADMVGSASRAMIAKAAETGKTWLLQYIFFAWLMAVSAVSMFRDETRPTPWMARGIQMIAIMLFMYAYIAIGNRRELAMLLIFLLVLSIFRRKRMLFAVAAMSFPVLLTLGLIRALEGSAVGEFDVTTNMLNLFGEFVFPHYPLLYYSDQVMLEHLLGRTYFNLPLYILPSFDLWEKAQSLAVQFSFEYADRRMGYALTPMAEGYVNFGWWSVVLVPLMLVATFRLLFHAARLVPFGMMILMSFPLDISRGEFTTMAFQWIIFSLTLTLVARIYTTPFSRGVH